MGMMANGALNPRRGERAIGSGATTEHCNNNTNQPVGGQMKEKNPLDFNFLTNYESKLWPGLDKEAGG